MSTVAGCPLCAGVGGDLIWRDDFLRVILADEPWHPAFLRVVLADHVAEMSDLDEDDRQRLMRAVFVVEGALREALAPHKVNLAALGNQVPHLHWHVIGRWRDDGRFPAPIWAGEAGDGVEARARRAWIREHLPLLRAAVFRALEDDARAAIGRD